MIKLQSKNPPQNVMDNDSQAEKAVEHCMKHSSRFDFYTHVEQEMKSFKSIQIIKQERFHGEIFDVYAFNEFNHSEPSFVYVVTSTTIGKICFTKNSVLHSSKLDNAARKAYELHEYYPA